MPQQPATKKQRLSAERVLDGSMANKEAIIDGVVDPPSLTVVLSTFTLGVHSTKL